jgi:hypothetical protein
MRFQLLRWEEIGTPSQSPTLLEENQLREIEAT